MPLKQELSLSSKMQNFLIKDSTIVPMVQNHEYFKGDILILKGKIQGIGSQLKAPLDVVEIDAQDCITFPGFIQGHIHLVQTLLRHHADDLELLDWLKKKTWPYEASLSGDGVAAASALGVAELLKGGTTTICDFGTTHSHERVFKTVEEMGIRYIGGKTMMNMGEDVPSKLLETTESSLRETYDLGKKWHTPKGRIQYAVTPRFAVSCSQDLMEMASRMARDHGWYLQTHSSENRSEVDLVKNITGRSNIQFLRDVGFFGEDTILAHCVHVSDEEIQLMSQDQTRVCHCPGSNLKLASGVAPIPSFLKNNIPVLLGADGAPCNNRLSVFHEMTLTATLHKAFHGPKTLPAWEVLGLATREAARALRIEDLVGTLEVGKVADIVVLKRKSLSMIPEADPASQVVYGAHPEDVSHVFVDGIPRVMNGDLVNQSLEEIIRNAEFSAKETQERIQKDLA